MNAPVQRTVRLAGPTDVARTLASLQHGPLDPTVRLDPTGVWRATITPDGPATVHLDVQGDAVEVSGWGPGAAWAIDRVPQLLGADDRPEDFDPPARVVRDLHRRFPGIRFGRSDAVFEALVPTILGQRVTGAEAGRSWRRIVGAFGDAAPGPGGLTLPPEPARIAGLGYFDLHPFGVERSRAMIVLRAATEARRLERACGLALPEAYRLLQAVPGIGPWTAAHVAGVALGDADAVPVGDLHLPNLVSWALAGEPRGTDERMLDLLEPYRPHRGRVVRLLKLAGPRPERRGPRYNPIPIAEL